MYQCHGTLYCDLCHSNFVIARNANECDECFVTFMMLVGALRNENYDYTTMIKLHYNLIADDIITLFLKKKPFRVKRGSISRFIISPTGNFPKLS